MKIINQEYKPKKINGENGFLLIDIGDILKHFFSDCINQDIKYVIRYLAYFMLLESNRMFEEYFGIRINEIYNNTHKLIFPESGSSGHTYEKLIQ